MERQGLISRFFSRTSDGDRQQNASVAPPPQGRGAWADNATRPVHALVKSVLQEPRCLIVTGYQDFLSTLTIVLDAVNHLAERPEGIPIRKNGCTWKADCPAVVSRNETLRATQTMAGCSGSVGRDTPTASGSKQRCAA
jgi:hypothetical protein